MKTESTGEGRYLDAWQAALYLRTTVGSLRQKTSRREVPFVRFGGRVLFDRAQLDAYLAARAVPAER
jgi:excisionase family DNA binding protein